MTVFKWKNTEAIGYTLPSTKSTRAAGFGIGERFSKSHQKSRKSPSPDTYDIPTVFKPNNTTSTFAVHVKGDKTFCFGSGREAFVKNVLHKTNPPPDYELPGPGLYDPLAPLGYGKESFKLKGKLAEHDPARIAIKRAVPAPGTYQD